MSYGILIPGLVAPFEERQAARFCLYNWREWVALAPTEKAESVAHYRLDRFVKLHENDAQQRATDKDLKKSRRRH